VERGAAFELVAVRLLTPNLIKSGTWPGALMWLMMWAYSCLVAGQHAGQAAFHCRVSVSSRVCPGSHRCF
jgi:hypothetical protein